MKRFYSVFAVLVALSFASCQKIDEPTSKEPVQNSYNFNITVANPDGDDTKSVKAGWTPGDKINLWFDGAVNDPQVVLTYNGDSWSGEQMDSELELSSEGRVSALFEGHNDFSAVTGNIPLVVVAQNELYLAEDNTILADISKWIYSTKYQVVVPGIEDNYADYSLSCEDLNGGSFIYKGTKTDFNVTPNVKYTELCVSGTSLGKATTGVRNDDGAAFYFTSLDTKITAPKSYTFVLRYNGKEYTYTSAETTFILADGQKRLNKKLPAFSVDEEGNPSIGCKWGISGEPITVTLFGVETPLTVNEEGYVTLPSKDAVGSYNFLGWSETNLETETNTAPSCIPAGEFSPRYNMVLYPVFKKTGREASQENRTATINISEYAVAHSWVNEEKYYQVIVDESISVKAADNSDGYTGQYNSKNNYWGMYQTSDSEWYVQGGSGATLTSVSFKYDINNTGILVYNNTQYKSENPISLSGSTSGMFTVGNTGSATNGQVRITGISVSYVYSVSAIPDKYIACPPQPTKLSAPTNLTCTDQTSNSLTFTWTAVENASGYKVSVDGGETYGASIDATSYTWDGLDSETAYTLYLKAIGDNDAYLDSEAISTTGTTSKAAQSYVITFKTGSGDGSSVSTSTSCSNIVSSGTDFLSGNVVSATKVYHSGSAGLKLGASGDAGTIKMNLSTAGQVTPKSIVVRAKLYNSGKATTLKVNDSATQNLSASFADYTYSITSKITYLELVSSKYCWIESITVNY